MQPTGRAIQVEGGGGERRPSADIRRQRTRDSDAVIQVRKLQLFGQIILEKHFTVFS